MLSSETACCTLTCTGHCLRQPRHETAQVSAAGHTKKIRRQAPHHATRTGHGQPGGPSTHDTHGTHRTHTWHAHGTHSPHGTCTQHTHSAYTQHIPTQHAHSTHTRHTLPAQHTHSTQHTHSALASGGMRGPRQAAGSPRPGLQRAPVTREGALRGSPGACGAGAGN